MTIRTFFKLLLVVIVVCLGVFGIALLLENTCPAASEKTPFAKEAEFWKNYNPHPSRQILDREKQIQIMSECIDDAYKAFGMSQKVHTERGLRVEAPAEIATMFFEYRTNTYGEVTE